MVSAKKKNGVPSIASCLSTLRSTESRPMPVERTPRHTKISTSTLAQAIASTTAGSLPPSISAGITSSAEPICAPTVEYAATSVRSKPRTASWQAELMLAIAVATKNIASSSSKFSA